MYLKISLKTCNNRREAVIGGINLVTIQDTELSQGILLAIDRAKLLSQPILVSEVQKVEGINPSDFFAAGRNRFLGERFFWKDPNEAHTLVGMGIAKQIQSNQVSNRFRDVESKWSNIIESAVIIGEQKESGTGPSLFGGFTFDPVKKKTKLWSKFSDSLFHIPSYMLSVVNGQAYLTTNAVCTQHDDHRLVEKINAERQVLLAAASQKQEFSIASIEHIDEIGPDEWKESVTDLVNSFEGSDLKKVVLARELRLRFNDDIKVERTLKHLLAEQPESYVFAFEVNGDCFLGASPERLVKREGEKVFSTCLAGSIARGSTPTEDRLLGESLLKDQKNLVEHEYVVEMIKEAMNETCEYITIPNRPELMKTKYIQHLYTPVIGKCKQTTSLLDIVDRLHPTPALGGLPQEAAVQRIREVEELDRGFYAAPIGWLDYHGNGEFAVAIRSALIQGMEASLFAGCGVVADSDAESEYIETSIKFRPMLTALGGNQR